MDEASSEQKTIKKFFLFFLLSMMFLLTLLLTSCDEHQPQNSKPPVNGDKTRLSTKDEVNWKIPIPKPVGELNKVVGWMNDNQIVYIVNLDQTSDVFQYDFLTGKNDLLFHSDHPIATVQISPSKKFLLIQSVPSTFEGVVTIIDTKGTELFKHLFAAFELAFEWNPYSESSIFVSKFNEDWTYQMFLIDLYHSNFSEVALPQPFLKWTDKDKIAFLNWDRNNPSLFAPLMVKTLGEEQEKEVFPSVSQFSAFPNLLMTITVDENDQSKAIYSFYNIELKRIFTFSIPQLTNYSNWLVPYNDYSERKNLFITFKPLKSGEADSYSDGFELVSYALMNGKKQLLMFGIENVPISLSPSGNELLYGNQLEKLIDLKTKKIVSLFPM